MEPMESLKRVLKWTCVFPFEETATKQEKVICILLTLFIFVANVCGFVSAIAFIRKFVSIDKEGSLFAIIQVLSFFNIIFLMIVTIFVRDKIFEAFQTLSQIYSANAKDESFRFLARANNATEWLCRIYGKISISVLTSMAILAIISIVYCSIWNEIDNEGCFVRMHRVLLPWNQATIIGYFGEVIFVIYSSLGIMIPCGICSILFVSMALHHHAFFKMVQNKLRTNVPDANRSDKEFVCDLINFLIRTKAWFYDTTSIFSPFLMVYLINNTMAMASVAFHFDSQLQHFDLGFWIIIIALTYLPAYNFFYCYFGKISTDSHVNMANCLYDYKWYDLPIESQKYFILMIQNAQRPVYYHGFGMINLDLETFTNLINTTFSYYMIFKTLLNRN